MNMQHAIHACVNTHTHTHVYQYTPRQIKEARNHRAEEGAGGRGGGACVLCAIAWICLCTHIAVVQLTLCLRSRVFYTTSQMILTEALASVASLVALQLPH